ncbi:NAD(P)H-dependent oxidoreductase [Mucilaginibacter lappiensis]|uniref:Nitroreductase n=1 Tax=Mucilaginibacter lappiensis TaxID=354630 RepID=A0A1N6RA95_9SPHI|nr:NAD(P)H-dependent oxidoreductase [Mucilaginibacter lappiensis]MBB6108742.1 nitroreductase [Mucilaginibacter lappiensis]MBB6129379.1 nitroreductase [Mucilaginibacter lappiensis]SIQ25820.1 Nitroreductase [Mucilaginibacter lappiensis]
MSLIEKLQWRSAVKKFDTAKKITAAQLDGLLSAVQLAPSSYGLQSYKIIVVQDAETKAKLRAAGYDQPQITDSSALFVFASLTTLDEDFGKKFIDLIASTRNVARETLQGYEQVILGTLSSRTDEQKVAWSHRQAYIALGVLLSAAAELGVDAAPMEGFDAEKFDEILGLKEKGLTASVIAAVGFRADDDHYSQMIKVRRPKEELFIHV